MKNLLLPRLLFVSILLLVIGCGSTEDETQQRMEDLVGSWEFVSFGEKPVDETINAFFHHTGVEDVKVDVTTNSLVFQQNGSWLREIEGEFIGDLSNLIEEVTLSKTSVNFSEQGTHFVSASSLSLVPQGVSVSVKPQYFWELVGTTEEDFAREFRSEVFGKIYTFSWTVQDDMLILTEAESGEKTVLRKK
ncbi:hypothetical protein F4Y93_01365 [Candidatus Poribacteria bacterium]|nr:hypothetical protein [Candidatus Poribacteria bacterium]